MIAVRTFDAELIKRISMHPGLFSKVAEDGVTGVEVDPVKTCCLLMITDDDQIAGYYSLDVRNSATLVIHANVLPEHRKQHSRATGKAALQWIYHNAEPSFQKVIAEVPDVHQNVINFVETFGFQREGLLTKAYWKGGELRDVLLFGLSRSKIPEVINV